MIHPVNQINANLYPSNPFYVEQEYKELYQQFCQNPSKENGEKLLAFLNDGKVREQMEQVAHILGYQLFPGMDIDQYIDGAKAALQSYLQGGCNESAVIQFGNNLACMIGIYGPPPQLDF